MTVKNVTLGDKTCPPSTNGHIKHYHEFDRGRVEMKNIRILKSLHGLERSRHHLRVDSIHGRRLDLGKTYKCFLR
eukprot:scaffold587_cov339-Pavlova_lutheri.AAC.76